MTPVVRLAAILTGAGLVAAGFITLAGVGFYCLVRVHLA